MPENEKQPAILPLQHYAGGYLFALALQNISALPLLQNAPFNPVCHKHLTKLYHLYHKGITSLTVSGEENISKKGEDLYYTRI